MQIPIINGIYTDDAPNIRVSYPVNLAPVIEPNGVSNGYLRPADGLIEFGDGPGNCRGSIVWDGVVYMVMGSKLVSVSSSGAITTIGEVGNNGQPVSMDYSFSLLCVVSNGNGFYYDKSTLTKITDPDFLSAIDVKWIDNYFLFTDGQFIFPAEINDPFAFDPLKYGSVEADPDKVVGVDRVRNEFYAVGRYSTEVFRNVGGVGFPFQRISGAQITKGAIGTHAFCVYNEAIAFVGSGREEENSVYIGINGRWQKIGTKEIDEVLKGYTEAQLSQIVVESRNDRSSQLLYVHLPDRTFVYDALASQATGSSVWYVLTSGIGGFNQYRASFFVFAYGKWIAGDRTTSKLSTLSNSSGHQFGEPVRWEFGTQMIYNESRGVVIPMLELVALTGSVEQGVEAIIETSYTEDGQTWSKDRVITAGTKGDRLKRLVWLRMGRMNSIRMQRFRGDSNSHISFIRLEAVLEPLAI